MQKLFIVSYSKTRRCGKNQKEFKSSLSNIKAGSFKSEEQLSEIDNIATFYNLWEEVIEFFKDYYRILNNALYNTKFGNQVKMLTPKQVLQKLPIALVQVKAVNTSQNLLNEICQLIYSLYQANTKIAKKVFNKWSYNTKMDTIVMNSENSETSNSHILLLNLLDKINLKWSGKYVALSNVSI